ncbi:MAG: hypothetical protein HY331_08260 [Chloroflexi bacterium]|nr:hypothetical protein [Chloroflexota bacterium]
MAEPYPGFWPAEEVFQGQGDLTDEAIDRLRAARVAYQQGRFSEQTLESKRLLFARWLYEHGRIQR